MKFFTTTTRTAALVSSAALRRALVSLVGVLLLSLQLPALAKNYINVGAINDVIFGTWQDSGTWSTTVSNCIASAPRRNPRPGELQLPYNARVSNLNQNNGFYLYLNGDANAAGNARILVGFAHRDLLAPPSSSENLVNNQYDSHQHIGQFHGCSNGNNSELRVTITGAELASKENGVYRGSFELSARNSDNEDMLNFLVGITVQRGIEVKISKLDPVNFGQHSGVGNLAANERLCIYSSAASGSYRLSITAANKDAGGNFYLAETGTGELIPMAVLFSASPIGTATTPMLNNYFSGVGNSISNDCGGTNNATLSLFMSEGNLQAASTGNYSETLIILVEPE